MLNCGHVQLLWSCSQLLELPLAGGLYCDSFIHFFNSDLMAIWFTFTSIENYSNLSDLHICKWSPPQSKENNHFAHSIIHMLRNPCIQSWMLLLINSFLFIVNYLAKPSMLKHARPIICILCLSRCDSLKLCRG